MLAADSKAIWRELGSTPRFADLKTIVSTAWRWHETHPQGYRSPSAA